MRATDPCVSDRDPTGDDIAQLDQLNFPALDWLNADLELNCDLIDLLGMEKEVESTSTAAAEEVTGKTKKRTREVTLETMATEAVPSPTIDHISDSFTIKAQPKGYISAFNFFAKSKRADLLLRSEYCQVWDFSAVSIFLALIFTLAVRQ